MARDSADQGRRTGGTGGPIMGWQQVAPGAVRLSIWAEKNIGHYNCVWTGGHGGAMPDPPIERVRKEKTPDGEIFFKVPGP